MTSPSTIPQLISLPQRGAKHRFGRIAGERNVLRLDALIEQPAIAGHHVVDWPRMHVLRARGCMYNQRAT